MTCTRAAAALLTSIAALLTISSGITPSSASTAKTWTVTPGGAAVAKSGVVRGTVSHIRVVLSAGEQRRPGDVLRRYTITPRQVITSP